MFYLRQENYDPKYPKFRVIKSQSEFWLQNYLLYEPLSKIIDSTTQYPRYKHIFLLDDQRFSFFSYNTSFSSDKKLTISDINALEKVKFENLEKLNFGFNKISDISVLSKVNFKRLNELHLYDNFISDISVFENTHFDRLRILKIVNNRIDKSRYNLIISKLNSTVNEFVI